MPGVILWEGRSQLDWSPIVAIATWDSDNAKTGNMVQTWIMRQNIDPATAQRIGADKSVCGSCPLRPANGGGCYVTTFQAPLSVWKAYRRGSYGYDRSIIPAIPRRLGSYGDPAAVPAMVWFSLVGSHKHTGYTHQASVCDVSLQMLVMASCESESQAKALQAKGWRTFRVKPQGATTTAGEIVCPSESKGITCERCGLCSGSLRAKNIAITAHGAKAKSIRYEVSNA